MLNSLFRWAHVLGAMPRIVSYYKHLSPLPYYERVRFCNAALGPDWIFRLQDLVGPKIISETRPSWLSFYHDDIYDQHLPLDPRAPETDKYLGKDMGSKEFAFYAGMGFDGYALALKTLRHVDTEKMSVFFDQFQIDGIDISTLREMSSKELDACDYYHFYGRALNALFDSIELIVASNGEIAESVLESTAAASLLFLCGGHHGCKSHISESEAQSVRLQTIVICRYVEALATGQISKFTESTVELTGFADAA